MDVSLREGGLICCPECGFSNREDAPECEMCGEELPRAHDDLEKPNLSIKHSFTSNAKSPNEAGAFEPEDTELREESPNEDKPSAEPRETETHEKDMQEEAPKRHYGTPLRYEGYDPYTNPYHDYLRDSYLKKHMEKLREAPMAENPRFNPKTEMEFNTDARILARFEWGRMKPLSTETWEKKKKEVLNAYKKLGYLRRTQNYPKTKNPWHWGNCWTLKEAFKAGYRERQGGGDFKLLSEDEFRDIEKRGERRWEEANAERKKKKAKGSAPRKSN